MCDSQPDCQVRRNAPSKAKGIEMDTGAPAPLKRYVALFAERGRMRSVDAAENLGVPEAGSR
jgi:hypothetical protein